MGWFYLFLARLAGGERWRKATPLEKRVAAAFFVFIPLSFALLLVLLRHGGRIMRFMDTASAPMLWALAVIGCSLGVFVCYVWSKRVPLKISLALAIVTWGILLWMLFGLGFWNPGKS